MGDYPFFPMFVDISERRVLVVGAGRVAARRVGTLLRFCGRVRVIAPEIHPDIAARSDALALEARAFAPSDLDGADIVLACTDDGALNAEIAAACRARCIPVNVASDRALSDFYFPGVVIEGDVTVGVTAGGRDHALARRATERVRRCLAGEAGE